MGSFGFGFGFSPRRRRLSGGGAPTPTPVTAAQITGDLVDRHNSTAGNGSVYQANEDIPLPVGGGILKVTFDGDYGTLDVTKITVNISRPGRDASGNLTTVSDVAYVTGVLRRAWPNDGSVYAPSGDAANTFYFTLDDYLLAGDSISSVLFNAGFYSGSSSFSVTSVANNSALADPKVVGRVVNQPFERVTGTHTVEIAMGHEFARNGRQVARVEAWFVDSNGAVGAVASSTAMARSAFTPSSGWMPGLPTDTYSLSVPVVKASDGTPLADGEVKLYWKAYCWVGATVWESATLGFAWPSYNTTDYVPFVLDVAGNHAAIYAWINQDGSAGASPAVQTGSSDPGSAASYATLATAAAAIKAYNNANRGHNDLSGGVIMLRDVVGSTLGSDTGAYVNNVAWSNGTNYPAGLRGIRIRRAGWSAGTAPDQLCRLRSVTGSSVNNKQVPKKVTLEGVMLDSSGKASSADNIIIYAGGASGSDTTGDGYVFLRDCEVYESSAASGANRIIYQAGWAYELRTKWTQRTLGWANPTGNYNSIVATVGSRSGGQTACALGCYVASLGTNDTKAVDGLPYHDGGIWQNVYAETTSASSSPFSLKGRIKWGWNICNALSKVITPGSNVGWAIGNDGTRVEMQNVVIQYGGSDGEGGGAGRMNFAYQDQGFTHIEKRATLKYSAIHNYNSKGDVFPAPENGNGATAWASAKAYVVGDMVTDGNATTAARLFYACKVDHTSGSTMATDLADTSKWRALGAVYGVTYGAQPLRTGTFRSRYQMRSFGNVIAATVGGTKSPSSASWYGDRVGRGGAVETGKTDFWTSPDISALGNLGDYTPKAGGLLLNRVPAGMACMPHDMFGNARLSDGTGAAGPIERV